MQGVRRSSLPLVSWGPAGGLSEMRVVRMRDGWDLSVCDHAQPCQQAFGRCVGTFLEGSQQSKEGLKAAECRRLLAPLGGSFSGTS